MNEIKIAEVQTLLSTAQTKRHGSSPLEELLFEVISDDPCILVSMRLDGHLEDIVLSDEVDYDSQSDLSEHITKAVKEAEKIRREAFRRSAQSQ